MLRNPSGSVSTSESMIPRPCFQALHTISFQFCYMFARSDTYFRLYLLLIIITNTCISLSLRRTSAPIYLTSLLGVFGTQETLCIVIAGLLERDSFDLLLPEFDKPWVIYLRETCCCSTNLCTWRPNTVYKNIRVRRHQYLSALFLVYLLILRLADVRSLSLVSAFLFLQRKLGYLWRHCSRMMKILSWHR
jgi:hypothetical protein